MKIGIIGGTGPAGRGLAVRAAVAGHEVVLGSRDAERASGVAAEIAAAHPTLNLAISGGTNEDAASQDFVVVATPWEGAVSTVSALRDALASKTVVSMVNALMKEGREMLPLYPPRGSMAAQISHALPGSNVAASFHHLPAKDMENLDSGLQADVLVCGDHDGARAETISFIDSLGFLRGIDAGSLAQASPIEAMTASLITINIRHKAHSTLRLAGI